MRRSDIRVRHFVGARPFAAATLVAGLAVSPALSAAAGPAVSPVVGPALGAAAGWPADPATATGVPETIKAAPPASGAATRSVVVASGAPDRACGPVRIEEGGRYTGCYRSSDPDVAAVTVATEDRVVLVGARIEHAGDGVAAEFDGTHIVVRDSRLVALDPHSSKPASQRAVTLFRPASFVAVHNRFSKGHGIWIAGDDHVVDPLRIAFNVSIDVGRFGHPTRPNCCVQFVQLDHVEAAAEITWNRTSNAAGRSSIEDNINLYGTSGLGIDAPLVVHHNLIVGAYPASIGSGDDYSGGGIMVADSGGDHVTVRRNRVVSTTNYGVAIVGGHDNHLLHNRLVNDGRNEAGDAIGPEYAVGVALWNPNGLAAPNDLSSSAGASEIGAGGMTDVDARHNVVGWLRGSDLTRNDTWLPACDPTGACTPNRSMADPITARTERYERRAWVDDLTAAGHTVGPR